MALTTAPDLSHRPRTTVLSNGFTLLVHEDDRFPLVAMRLFVRAGSVHELPEQAGISHMLEHMVFKGTLGRGAGRVAEEIEAVGGELNAATGFDATMYTMDLPAEHWSLGLDVLKDMLFHATIDTGELESERQVILAEMDRGDDDPHRRMFKAVQQKIWADTPYARPIIGFPETVRGISREDVLAYVRRRYQPMNMLLVVCGNIREGEVLDEVQVLFGSLVNRDGIQTPVGPPACLSVRHPEVCIARGPWQKAHLTLALPLPGMRDIQSVGLDVLAQMLGGDRTSLLYRTFKHEQGLVDTISAAATALDQVGMLTIQAQLDPENIPRLWPALVELLAGLEAAAFSAEILDRAKLNMEDGLFQAKETLSGLASKLGYFQFHEHALEAEQTYLHVIRHMDTSQLQTLISAHIRPEGLVGMVFTPRPEVLDAAEMTSILKEKWPLRKERAGALGVLSGEQTRQEVIHLAPGRTLVLLPDTALPYTALTMTWSGGDLLLLPAEQGLSELTARAWTKGTLHRSAVQIQDFLADRAIRLAAGAGLDQFSLTAHFPTRFSAELLPLLAELIHEPAWAEEELSRARQEQAASIVRTEDNPVGLAFRQAFPFLFPGHPYGYQRSGTLETVAAFSREQIMSFWNRQKDRPWVIAASGDIDRDKVVALAREIARSEAMPAPVPANPKWGLEHSKRIYLKDRNQSHIFVVFPVPGLDHAHTPGLTVLREMLAGQSGILFRDLRDTQGLAYSVTALLWQNVLAGFLAFYIGTSPDKEAAAMQGFQDVVQRLSADFVPEPELERAKNLLWGDYQRDRQRLIVRAHETAENLARGYAVDQTLHAVEQARHVTAKDVALLVGQYLRWDKAYQLHVMP